MPDHGELLLAIKRPRVREHLHPDVVAVSLDVRQRQMRKVVDECRRVLTEHRDVRDLFDFHQGGGEVARQGFGIRERPTRGINVDHGHAVLLPFVAAAVECSSLTSPCFGANGRVARVNRLVCVNRSVRSG